MLFAWKAAPKGGFDDLYAGFSEYVRAWGSADILIQEGHTLQMVHSRTGHRWNNQNCIKVVRDINTELTDSMLKMAQERYEANKEQREKEIKEIMAAADSSHIIAIAGVEDTRECAGEPGILLACYYCEDPIIVAGEEERDANSFDNCAGCLGAAQKHNCG